MKIISKEILSKKENTKLFIIGSPALKSKGMSKSVSKSVKAIDMQTPNKKGKDKQLKIIKETVKKKR